MVIFIGISAAFFSALTNVYLKKLFNSGTINELAPLNFFLNAIMMVIFSPLFYYFNPSLKGIIILIEIFILDTLANYFYYVAIESTEVSYTSIFMSLSPMFTLMISTPIISVLPLKSLICVIGIILSIYILNIGSNLSIYEPVKNIFVGKNYLGLVVAFFTGTGAVFTKIVFEEGVINPATLYLFRSVFIFSVLTIILKPKLNNLTSKIIMGTWFRAILVICHLLLYYYAISFGNVVIASTVSNIYPAFVLILSYFMFKEKITLQKWAAILSILFFITLLNYTI